MDEKYILNWLVIQNFKIFLLYSFNRLWLKYEKLKLYPYTLDLCQLEKIINLIDVLFLCTCNSILQKCDMYFLYLQFKKNT